jgi:hypothetical protein
MQHCCKFGPCLSRRRNVLTNNRQERTMEKIAFLCILMTSILAASSWTGLPGSDHIRELVKPSKNNGTPLTRRMVALDLDPFELSLSDPALVRHLQRQCTLGESRESCLRDVASDRRGAARRDRREWRECCPNASALGMLTALQSRLQNMPKYSFPYLG